MKLWLQIFNLTESFSHLIGLGIHKFVAKNVYFRFWLPDWFLYVNIWVFLFDFCLNLLTKTIGHSLWVSIWTTDSIKDIVCIFSDKPVATIAFQYLSLGGFETNPFDFSADSIGIFFQCVGDVFGLKLMKGIRWWGMKDEKGE